MPAMFPSMVPSGQDPNRDVKYWQPGDPTPRLVIISFAMLVVLGLALSASAPGIAALSALLFAFFCGSNILEASQPSIASRSAPAHARGAALGFYNTLQSLGFFAGGALGGLLMKAVGPAGLFGACAAAMTLWLLVAWPMKPIASPLRKAA